MPDSITQNDHDLIIRLDTKVGILIDKVDSLQSNLVGRVNDLEEGKATSEQKIKDLVKLTDDHEKRIRRLEKWALMAVGAITIINFIIELYILTHPQA